MKRERREEKLGKRKDKRRGGLLLYFYVCYNKNKLILNTTITSIIF